MYNITWMHQTVCIWEFKNSVFTLGLFDLNNVCDFASHLHTSICLTNESLSYKIYCVILHKRALAGLHAVKLNAYNKKVTSFRVLQQSLYCAPGGTSAACWVCVAACRCLLQTAFYFSASTLIASVVRNQRVWMWCKGKMSDLSLPYSTQLNSEIKKKKEKQFTENRI